MKNHDQHLASAPRGGFTLVELLLVVAIIAILITLLLPAVRNGMEHARGVQCAAVMREVGMRVAVYVNDHEGRLPAMAAEERGGTYKLWGWSDLLDVEVSDNPPISWNGMKRKGHLYCPSADYVGVGSLRCWRYSRLAAGGSDPTAVAHGQAGPYGKIIEGPKVRGRVWRYYRLGTPLSLFPRPSGNWLVVESHSYGGVYVPRGGGPLPTMGDNPSYPPYTGSNGTYSFRHMGTANFLCVDLHVQRVTPKDDVNAARHSQF